MQWDWQRIGAAAGVLFLVAVVASFFTPETPDADDATAEIVTSIADDRSAHLVTVYLQGTASFLFIVFVGALWSRLRRAEAEPGASVLVALGGLGSAVVILVSRGIFLALVDAAHEGRAGGRPRPVRAGRDRLPRHRLDVGRLLRRRGALVAGHGEPAPLVGWLAALVAAVFMVAFFGIFSEDDEGGVLGGIFFVAILVNFIWILVASIVLLREQGAE